MSLQEKNVRSGIYRLLDNKASFASEISKVNLVDEDDETIEPPTAIENDTKTSRDDSRS